MPRRPPGPSAARSDLPHGYLGWLSTLLPWFFLSIPVAVFAWWAVNRTFGDRGPIVVGILHARGGVDGEREKHLLEAEVLALEQINAEGGLLGRRLRWVIADGGNDGASFARQADRLIRDERADVIIGCATTGSRRAVTQVVEVADHLLITPDFDEGLGISPNVVSLGPLPNQQVVPVVAWCHGSLGARRLFVVGSDSTWSRAAGALAADQLRAIGATLVGEDYLTAASPEVSATARAIAAARPDAVLSLLDFPAAAALVRRLHDSGLDAADTPVVLFGVDENDLRTMPGDDVAGHYAAGPMFPGVTPDSAHPFSVAHRVRHGDRQSPPAFAFSGHHAVRLWAGAVRAAGTADVAHVRWSIRHQSLPTPEGVVAIDPVTLHAWRSCSIGRIRPDGSIDPVWASTVPVRPAPFPATRSPSEWARFLASMQRDLSSLRPAPEGGAGPGESP